MGLGTNQDTNWIKQYCHVDPKRFSVTRTFRCDEWSDEDLAKMNALQRRIPNILSCSPPYPHTHHFERV